MKKLTLFILFLGVLGFANAQEPNWISSDYRSQNYPSNSYLVGFSETSDVNKKYIDEELKQMVDAAKSQLIQSVRVQVNSVSTSKVSDFNGEIDDYFNQKTTSQSDLKLVGLQTESYYDKKEKKAYAIAYVSKMKMVEYYRSEIGKNIIDITNIIDQSEQLLESSNLKKAFESGLGAYNKFFDIDESQKVLMAIGATSSLDVRVEEVNELNSDFQSLMLRIKTDKRMSIDDLGFIVANGLMKFQGDDHRSIKLTSFTYEQTGFTSDFSYKLSKTMEQSLPEELQTTGYVIKGVYLYEGDVIVVKSSIADVKSNRVLGRITAKITEAELISNTIGVIPPDIKNLGLLEVMEITSHTVGASGKSGLGLNKELVAKVTVNGELKEGVPVQFLNNNSGVVYCSTITDKNGTATCHVKKISGEYKNQVIVSTVNLKEYLSNDTSVYVTNLLKNKDLPKASFKVVVEPSTIYIEAQENNFGESLDVKLIEPQIKESLSSKGFDFDDHPDGSDYVIKVKASSRKGGNFSGVYFAYVDVTISVYDNNLGKEIFKESINNVKGGGGTFDQAGGKAFYAASDQVREKIVSILVD
jgi:hypothetical protein